MIRCRPNNPFKGPFRKWEALEQAYLCKKGRVIIKKQNSPKDLFFFEK